MNSKLSIRFKMTWLRYLPLIFLLTTTFSVPMLFAQNPKTWGDLPLEFSNTEKSGQVSAPDKVEINHLAHDEEISQRIEKILLATGWFSDPQVSTQDGVVFLSGKSETAELKIWAGNLARNTQDVVAVVNHMGIVETSFWDLRPAWDGLLVLWRDIIRSLPFLFFALLVLMLSMGASVLTSRGMRRFLNERIHAKLLRNVLAGGSGILVLLIGIYIVLRVSGLTQLALTVVGGTGLVGLALGIAFKNITENFLASIFLSIQRPFETGDLVEVAGETGYVQQLNMRTTVLMTFAGNLVQIPNSVVYQSNLRNYTTNANRRDDFAVGIGYDDSINDAQEVALKVLIDHPAVLNYPEPSVLADSLGQATVNLQVYYWFNGREHSWLKVRSSVIRLIKLSFQEHGISMPDEAREIIFPQGVPVNIIEAKSKESVPIDAQAAKASKKIQNNSNQISTEAEGGLSSEAAVLDDQAKQVRDLREGENLLKTSPAAPAKKT